MEKIKRNMVLFILLIFAFPVLVESMYFLVKNGLENINWNKRELFIKFLEILKNYMSFYATALTISFTVYTFTKSQEKIEKDRLEEKEKEREIRTKEKEKELEIRKKELEDKRDFYRPTFIIEKNRHVKLLMRDDNLYLEDIIYCYDPDRLNYTTNISSLKSGDYVVQNVTIDEEVYIIAKTQIGENILFGYLNGGIKVHKYLKEGRNPLVPSRDFNKYNQEEVNQTWGTYNTDRESEDEILDQIFYYNTSGIRERLLLTHYESIKGTLTSTSANYFFKKVFKEIVDGYKVGDFSDSSVYITTIDLLKSIKSDINNFEIESDNIRYDYMIKQFKILNCSGYIHFESKLSKRTLDFQNFIELGENFLIKISDTIDSKEKQMKYIALLTMLMEVFYNVNVDANLDYKIIQYKALVYNKLRR